MLVKLKEWPAPLAFAQLFEVTLMVNLYFELTNWFDSLLLQPSKVFHLL